MPLDVNGFSDAQKTLKELKTLIQPYEACRPWQLPLCSQQPYEQLLTIMSWIIKSTGIRFLSYCIRIRIVPQEKTYAGIRKDVNKAWLDYLHAIPHDDPRDCLPHLKFENLTSLAILEHTLLNQATIDASSPAATDVNADDCPVPTQGAADARRRKHDLQRTSVTAGLRPNKLAWPEQPSKKITTSLMCPCIGYCGFSTQVTSHMNSTNQGHPWQ